MPSGIQSIAVVPWGDSKVQFPMSTLSFDGLCMVTHSLPSSLPAGFWSKAYNITFEEADEVAIAIPTKRSTKAPPNINAFFLSILSDFDDSRLAIYISLHQFPLCGQSIPLIMIPGDFFVVYKKPSNNIRW